MKKKKRSTGPSRVVPHRSTTPARTSLTSLFGWEAVSLVDMAALTRAEHIKNFESVNRVKALEHLFELTVLWARARLGRAGTPRVRLTARPLCGCVACRHVGGATSPRPTATAQADCFVELKGAGSIANSQSCAASWRPVVRDEATVARAACRPRVAGACEAAASASCGFTGTAAGAAPRWLCRRETAARCVK